MRHVSCVMGMFHVSWLVSWAYVMIHRFHHVSQVVSCVMGMCHVSWVVLCVLGMFHVWWLVSCFVGVCHVSWLLSCIKDCVKCDGMCHV